MAAAADRGGIPIVTMMTTIVTIWCLLQFHGFSTVQASSAVVTLDDGNNGSSTQPPPPTVQLAKLKYHEVKNYLIVTIFIILLIILKIFLHRVPFVSDYLPESCILLILGILFGLFFRFSFEYKSVLTIFHLENHYFFFILLPPIILEASYGLHAKPFYQNFGKILLFAVVGTILNTVLLTLILKLTVALELIGVQFQQMSMLQVALFSSFVVAVDPVAVLAIFQEIGVNLGLYFLVFGESLFNDAITIVIYEIVTILTLQPSIEAGQVALGVMSFFTVSIGGVLIGLLCGVISCLLTRFSADLETLQPLIILVSAYLAYIVGDLFGWSGIISLIVCGLMHCQYGFHNISRKSVITSKRAMKILAQLSESVIFLFLGLELMSDQLIWDAGFICCSLFGSLLVRALIVFALCFVVNRYSSDKAGRISYSHQIIMIYGGLRGAVAYALATIIPKLPTAPGEKPSDELKNLFLASTLVIVLVTNLLMGTTMKGLVALLQIAKKKPEQWSLFEKMNNSVMEHATTAMEEVTGRLGSHSIMSYLRSWDDRFFRAFLTRDPITHDQQILHTYEKVSMALHLASVHPNQSDAYLHKLPKSLHDLSVASKLNAYGNHSDLDMRRPSMSSVCVGIEVAPPSDTDDGGLKITTLPPKSIVTCSLPNAAQPATINRSIRKRLLQRGQATLLEPDGEPKDIFRTGKNRSQLRDFIKSRYDDDFESRFDAALRRKRALTMSLSSTMPPPVTMRESDSGTNKQLTRGVSSPWSDRDVDKRRKIFSEGVPGRTFGEGITEEEDETDQAGTALLRPKSTDESVMVEMATPSSSAVSEKVPSVRFTINDENV